MKKADIYQYKNKIFSHLSGGEKQRVMIARAFAQKTNVLLLDEFTSHLDPGHTQSLMKLIQESVKEEENTVISVFHDINLASLYSNRIILFDKGKIVIDGKPEEVISEKHLKEIYNFNGLILKHPIYEVPQVIYY